MQQIVACRCTLHCTQRHRSDRAGARTYITAWRCKYVCRAHAPVVLVPPEIRDLRVQRPTFDIDHKYFRKLGRRPARSPLEFAFRVGSRAVRCRARTRGALRCLPRSSLGGAALPGQGMARNGRGQRGQVDSCNWARATRRSTDFTQPARRSATFGRPQDAARMGLGVSV